MHLRRYENGEERWQSGVASCGEAVCPALRDHDRIGNGGRRQ